MNWILIILFVVLFVFCFFLLLMIAALKNEFDKLEASHKMLTKAVDNLIKVGKTQVVINNSLTKSSNIQLRAIGTIAKDLGYATSDDTPTVTSDKPRPHLHLVKTEIPPDVPIVDLTKPDDD